MGLPHGKGRTEEETGFLCAFASAVNPGAGGLIRLVLDLDVIVKHCDWMARGAASVADRRVPANVVLRQIENAPDNDPRAMATKMLGTVEEPNP